MSPLASLPSAPVDPRPSWDEYFFEVAKVVAQRSTCPRANVGCVIVKEKRILTTGYNGAPSHLPHCAEEGCLMEDGHCIRTLHAEQNALIQAALHGISTKGATVYVTHQPCYQCAKMIVNAGVIAVLHGGVYRDARSLRLLADAGVKHWDITVP